MSLFDGFNTDTFGDLLLEDTPKSIPNTQITTTNDTKEIPTKVDEQDGKAKPAPGGAMVIQSKCPIAISSTTENDKPKVMVHAYIRGMIDDLDGYVPLLNILQQANEDTDIYIHIQSGGGMVTTGLVPFSLLFISSAEIQISFLFSQKRVCSSLVI